MNTDQEAAEKAYPKLAGSHNFSIDAMRQIFLAGCQYKQEQMDQFAVNAMNWISEYYGRASKDGIWYNLCDLLGEEPLTIKELLELYKKANVPLSPV